MSMPPNRSKAESTAERLSSARLTSQRTNTPASSPARRSPAVLSTSAMTTRAPASASRRATRAPIPLAPPVTSATRFWAAASAVTGSRSWCEKPLHHALAASKQTGVGQPAHQFRPAGLARGDLIEERARLVDTPLVSSRVSFHDPSRPPPILPHHVRLRRDTFADGVSRRGGALFAGVHRDSAGRIDERDLPPRAQLVRAHQRRQRRLRIDPESHER